MILAQEKHDSQFFTEEKANISLVYCSVVALAIVKMSLLLSMITRCGVVLRECCIVVKV